MADFRLEFWPARSRQAPIAFLTMARDETILLEAWVKNGLRICPEAAFYVIDHASSPSLSESLANSPGYNGVNLNFVSIPPVPFDDDFKAMAMSGFAKMLLHCYDIVVATDCDELLVGLGIGADEVLPKLQSLDGITAPIGFEIVQHTEKEAPFDPSQDIELQRGYGFFASGYTKPVIWKARSEFGAGLHRSREDFAYETSLGLLHLRSVDQEMSLERAAQRRQYELSVGQVDQGRGGNWLNPQEKKADFFAGLRSVDVIPTFNDLLEGFYGELTETHHKNGGGFWGHNINRRSNYCDISSVLYV
ncbi:MULTISPECIES: hypothetical protein [unclassified Arthrobacter]|uniref:hypothetical protein n=1 Tax=unclassified Arthrobacter TaxID=235627 RepID=UPI001DE8F482|nr:hypothetical protein [Arthrobacter sp. Bi26]CAH0157810.1 hypothetical protein SRABI26_00875 [Arthrobacter sp. Bi26]